MTDRERIESLEREITEKCDELAQAERALVIVVNKLQDRDDTLRRIAGASYYGAHEIARKALAE